MEPGGLSFAQYMLGIIVAILIFLIKEALADARAGFRFRKRVVADVKLLVENHFHHLPTLTKQIEVLDAAIKTLEGGGQPERCVAMIWSNEYTLLDHLYQNSSYLHEEAFQETVRFYDTIGRSNQVRCDYNQAVRHVLERECYDARSFRFLASCLKALRANYHELIERGCNAVIVIAAKHWLVGLEVARYRNILTEISRQGA
jgi:hypothetical protein